MEPPSRAATTAIVAGGGPAGALLALLLARAHLPVTLIERQQDFSREFRGEGLSPSGQAMFREAGLWRQFESLPHTTFQHAQLYFKGKLVSKLSFDHLPNQHVGRFVSQPAILEMLVKEASQFPEFQFVRGGRVLEPLWRNERVAGVKVRTEAGDLDLRSQYTFAADGRFSLLRRSTGLDRPRSPQGFDVVWCKLPMPSFFHPEHPPMRGYFGNGHVAVCIPSYDGRLQLGWIIEKGGFKTLLKSGEANWLDDVSAFVDDDMANHIRANKDHISHPFRLDVVSDCYERWSVPGLTLLGDAAHPMSPFGSQGINIALRDAVVAANHFIPGFRSERADTVLDELAFAFREERIREVAVIQKYQAMAPKFQLSTSRWIEVAVLLMRLASASGLLSIGTKIGTRYRHPFVHGVTEVRLAGR